MIKALIKLGMEGTYFKIIKTIYDKPVANIILNGGKSKTISPKARNMTRVSPPVFNIVLEFLAKAIRQEEEIQEIQIDKEEVKLSLFVDEIIFYLKDLENSTKNSQTS
jgi:hypothetical protein